MNDFLTRFGPWAVVTGASSGIGEAFGDVLNVDYRDSLRVGLIDGTLDVLQDNICIPQRKLAFMELVVLKIDHQ